MEKYRSEIYSPKLVGNRFTDHTLPLELLEDLSVLKDITIEVAKWIYLKENMGRQRVPRGFTKGITFELSAIEEGSTIAKILLVANMVGLFPPDDIKYFEQAKDSLIQAIQAAEDGEDVKSIIPEQVLPYFNKLGNKLRDDEYIEFNPAGTEGKRARLNRETRKRLILASSKTTEFTQEMNLRGYVTEMDKARASFQIETFAGQKITASYLAQHMQDIQDAFNQYENRQRVLLKGVGTFDRNEKLQAVEAIESITLLDDLDVPSRLEELALLKDGWLNGEGQAPTKAGADWLAQTFENYYSPSLPLPYTFPTPEGGIQMEWSENDWEISLSIQLKDKTASFHAVNLNTDKEQELALALTKEDDWAQLNTKLNEILQVQA